MARAQFKIVIAVLAVSFLAAIVLGVVYFVRNEYLPARDLARDVARLKEDSPPPPDLGVRMFDEAVALLQDNEVLAARDRLMELMSAYPESAAVPEARRIVGEIHMDLLLSRRPMPGKLEYVVARGDALAAIARRNRTTIEYILQVNEMSGTTIHPGDRLVVFPLEFGIDIDLGERTVTLLQDGEFFASYPLLDYRLPPGMRIPTVAKVTSRSAWLGEERVLPTDPDFPRTQKWLQCSRPGTHAGIVIAGLPDDAEGAEAARERLVSGLFLADADMEELYTVVREGTIVTIDE